METHRSENAATDICKHLPEQAFAMMNSRATGLSSSEVEERRMTYGKNVITEKKGTPIILVFMSNFISMMAILLWISGAIAFFADMPQLGFAIWMVNIINGVFSFWQEYRASKATEALKKMLPSYAKVLRDGQECQILADDIVPGDIMLIAEGDRISADARLLIASDLQVNQSTLTGESNPVRKIHDPVITEGMTVSEIPNLVFAGTTVASGTAKAVVFSTGMDTLFGKIATLTQSMKEEDSPLQKELNILTRQISIIALSLGAVFFIAAIFIVKEPIAKSFIFSLGMIVAFIPEGLLPTVTLALAMAVQRMAKENALVKKLSAVETLGCTTVICSDKTGTLTQNEMTVCNLWMPDFKLDVTGLGYSPEGIILDGEREIWASESSPLRLLLTAGSLCNNARLIPPNEDHDRYTVIGDPTEACITVAAKKAGLDVDKLAESSPRIRELPFDSKRKRMSTIHSHTGESGKSIRIAYIKGSPREVIELCSKVSRKGVEEPITAADKLQAMEANDAYARNGLRVLAVAYREISDEKGLPATLSAYTPDIIEQDMTFVGLIAMSDPPRPEVTEAVSLCRTAKIRIIMITGDYGLTAESIARRVGIVDGTHVRIVSGMELAGISDDELKLALSDEVIFARVAPEQKYRIVSCLQELGEIVAVTGDGVNDSPALKKADIGVAMGITGTDVAKEAADMILTDDNFASIVRAIEQGRAVYSNIKKFLVYVFNSNLAEATPSAAFLLSKGAIPLPLTVMQILAIDLGTDMLPALGLGTELPEEGTMKKPPRSRNDRLLDKKVIIKAFLWYGALESVFAMTAYFLVNALNGWPGSELASSGAVYIQATTLTLAAIVFGQVGAVLGCRTETQSIFKVGIFSNKMIVRGIIAEIVLICAVSYIPFLQDIFHTGPIGFTEWLFLVIVPIPMIILDELRKAILRKLRK